MKNFLSATSLGLLAVFFFVLGFLAGRIPVGHNLPADETKVVATVPVETMTPSPTPIAAYTGVIPSVMPLMADGKVHSLTIVPGRQVGPPFAGTLTATPQEILCHNGKAETFSLGEWTSLSAFTTSSAVSVTIGLDGVVKIRCSPSADAYIYAFGTK